VPCAIVAVTFGSSYGAKVPGESVILREGRCCVSSLLSAAREPLARFPALQRLVTRALERAYGIVDTERHADDPPGHDLGSEKGRVVLQAARRYPFKRVIGVECREELTAVARASVERSPAGLRARDVELVTADVLEWEIPDDITIVYLYNPFVGELFAGAMERLIALVDRRQRGSRLIYVKPTEHERLLATGRVGELPPPRGWMARLRGVPPSQLRRYEIHPGPRHPPAERERQGAPGEPPRAAQRRPSTDPPHPSALARHL
jgi:hypothetical protein